MMNKDPLKISSLLDFLSMWLDHNDDYESVKRILGIETWTGEKKKMFYQLEVSSLDGLSLMEFINSQGDKFTKQREELVDLAVKISRLDHGGDQNKAMEEVMDCFCQSGNSGFLRNIISSYILHGKHDFVFQCLKKIKSTDLKVNLMMNKDPARISLLLHFISNRLDKTERNGKNETIDILGLEIMTSDDQRHKMFYLVSSEALGGFSLLQYIESESVRLLRQREELIDLAVKIAELRHGENSKPAMEEVIKNFKSGLASGVGLRDMIDMIKERYPWSNNKRRVMTMLHILTCVLGVGLYLLDIHTDVQFSLEMLNRSSPLQLQKGKRLMITPEDYHMAGKFAVWHCIQPIVITLIVFLVMRDGFSKLKKKFLNFFEKPKVPEFFEKLKDKDLNCFLFYLPTLFYLFCMLFYSLVYLLKVFFCLILALGSVVPIPAFTLLYRLHLDLKFHKARSKIDFRTNKAELEIIEKEIRQHEAVGKLSTFSKCITSSNLCFIKIFMNRKLYITVIIGLLIEASIESYFQFWLQSNYSFLDILGLNEMGDLFNLRIISIILSFITITSSIIKIRCLTPQLSGDSDRFYLV